MIEDVLIIFGAICVVILFTALVSDFFKKFEK
jgi:hypothetical protein